MDTRTYIEFNTNTNQIKVSGTMLPNDVIINLEKKPIKDILYGDYKCVYYDKSKYWDILPQNIISLSMIYELIAEELPFGLFTQDVAFVIDGICFDDWQEMWLDKIREAYQTHIQFNSRFNTLKVTDLLTKSSETIFIDEHVACKLMSTPNEDEAADIILKTIGCQDRIGAWSKIKLICSTAFDDEKLGTDNDGLRALCEKLYNYYNCNHEEIYKSESNYEPIRFQLTEKGKALAESLNDKEAHYDYDDAAEGADYDD